MFEIFEYFTNRERKRINYTYLHKFSNISFLCHLDVITLISFKVRNL